MKETALRHRQLFNTFILGCIALPAICVFANANRIAAQPKPAASESAPFCNRSEAIDTIRQQIDATKTIDESIRRIAVLIRAADLLWPMQQNRARTAFTEAFELASQNEKEVGKKGPRSLIMRLQVPDQRHIVIRAVAKRDSRWAKELTQLMLKQDSPDDSDSSRRDSFDDLLTAERLLDSAIQLITSDMKAALDLARASLKYPATSNLSRFLYTLAAVDQQAADQFYSQALSIYADRPMREFLYLATYPFAFRSSGDTPVFGFYQVPDNFALNNGLQRQFTLTLLRRAQQALEVRLDERDNFNGLSGTAHVWQTLVRIEPPVGQRLPELLEAVVQSREKVFVSLTVENQEKLVARGNDTSALVKSFRERIEAAEKSRDVNVRDDSMVAAILDSSVNEEMSDLLAAVEKISDSDLRNGARQWLYFRQSSAAAGGNLAEAERLIGKVEMHEQQAFLYAKLAKALLAKPESQTHAREILDLAINEANKAETTVRAARVLLTASNLYATIDLGRSISVLGEAIDRINHIESPDFNPSNQTLVKYLGRKSNPGGRFVFYFYMPGLDPETAFRELAKIDFNDALTQTTAFTDKFQRAMTSLAVADVCLQETERRRVTNPKKNTDS